MEKTLTAVTLLPRSLIVFVVILSAQVVLAQSQFQSNFLYFSAVLRFQQRITIYKAE